MFSRIGALVALMSLVSFADNASAQLVNVQFGGGYRQRMVTPFIQTQAIGVPVAAYAQQAVAVQAVAPACAVGTCAPALAVAQPQAYAVQQRAAIAQPVYQQTLAVAQPVALVQQATYGVGLLGAGIGYGGLGVNPFGLGLGVGFNRFGVINRGFAFRSRGVGVRIRR